MKFNKIVNEVKDIKTGDEVTISGDNRVWTVGQEEDDYFMLSNEDGEEAKISKYKIADLKKVPMLEYKTQYEKDEEIRRYKESIKAIKAKMRKYKKNSRGSDSYKKLEKELARHEAALNLASRQTPRMTIY